jgi:hypothetical protein
MRPGKRVLIKMAYATGVLFLTFSLCPVESIPLLSINLALAGECDAPEIGPWSGDLEHTKDKTIADHRGGIYVKDFIAEAEFYNPYSTSEGKWDYGFLFRYAKGEAYAVQIAYDGTWRHLLSIEGTLTPVREGNVILHTEANQSNHMRIIVIGNSGALYVNGQLVATLDTSGLSQKGDVGAATGINYKFKTPEKVTPVKNFTVWSLDIPTSSPLSGSLEDKKDSKIEVFPASVNVKDFITEAVFYNPYSPSEGKWDYGFLFRRVTEDTLYAIRVTSEDIWSFAVKFGGDWNVIKEGTILMPTGANQSNRLRIIVIGNNGWFFVNNQFITTLDTSGLTQTGDVRAATGIITDNEIENKVTQVESFAIWSLDGCPELPIYIPYDEDNDGVTDEEDECENPGCDIVDEKGCPKDTDGDGLDDCVDDCRYQKGPASNDGCPSDTDHDKITDDKDECENPGCDIVDEKGCPKDTDGDGLDDCVDDCPTEFGERKHNGCPDTDNDGVIDDKDECENRGCDIVDEKGCPKDTDLDGVIDCEDECPNQKGHVSNNGCPSSPYLYAIPVIIAIIVIAVLVQKKRKEKKKLEEKAVKEKAGKTICPFCKNEVGEDWISCPYCGLKLKEDTQTY